jgi:glyoxylase-like metal-dependent hydrolase (beta-lactamase superfamily II)
MMAAMEEILPGVLHWARVHENTGSPAHSYYVADRQVLIDPMEPEEGMDALAEHGEPQLIVLTVRHHLRHSERFAERFGCEIVAHEAGLHEFDDGPPVRGFRYGDELAPGIRALELGEITPEDTVLHIHAGLGALHFGDGLIRRRGQLGFVSDRLIGDDPEGVKRRTVERLRRLLEEDFDALLFAHGEPLGVGGRGVLEAFVGEHAQASD